jgi:hypothetical protein
MWYTIVEVMKMPQGKKLLILNVLEILKKHSDADHRLSVTDIVGIMKKEYDMIVDRKAVKRNLDELRDMGYRISSTDSVRKKKDGTEEILQTDWYLSSDFSEAELRGETDIDVMAGKFGEVMAQIVVCKEDEWSDNLRRFGFFLGKFIYLLDAYEDVEEDIRKGTYNPLKKIYHNPDFEEECRMILTMMMSECCKEFELLPILENVEILRNVLYSGVWCRYEAVREKRSKVKGKDHE